MNFLKSILSFVIAIFALYFIQKFINFPPLPVFSVYIAALLFNSEMCITRFVTISLTGILGTILYALSAYLTITHYPTYGNWFAVISDIFVAILFVSATLLLLGQYKRRWNI